MTLHLLEQIFSLYIKESVVAFEMNLIHCTEWIVKNYTVRCIIIQELDRFYTNKKNLIV